MIKNEQIAAVRAAIIKAVPDYCNAVRVTANVVWVIANDLRCTVRLTKVSW